MHWRGGVHFIDKWSIYPAILSPGPWEQQLELNYIYTIWTKVKITGKISKQIYI